MCLVAIALDAAPGLPLVLAGNRDEFHARPAAPAAFWADHPGVLAGRDLEAGGSWLGVNRQGRLAVVTNHPGRPAPLRGNRSRGELVTGFLTGAQDHDAYLDKLASRAGEYAGFSFACGDARGMGMAAAFDDGPAYRAALPRGITVITNATPGERWPKSEFLEGAVRDALAGGTADLDTLFNALFDALAVTTPVAKIEGADDNPWLRARATPFIRGDRYGTRASTVIVMDAKGRCRFIERGFDAAGKMIGEVVFEFGVG